MNRESTALARTIRRPALLGLALLVAAVLGVTAWSRTNAQANAMVTGREVARTQRSLLSSELQKFGLLPVVLVEYPEVIEALRDGSRSTIGRLNARLALLSDRTNAAVIYLIRSDGQTVAASNWNTKASFVGQNYGFRPYFRDALRNGSAELFALGTVSGRPGLFIARRVMDRGHPVGVIVVKVEFDAIEQSWTRLAGPIAVTDRDGVVIITSRPEWKFRRTRPLAAAVQARMLKSRQYGDRPLDVLPVTRDGSKVTAAGAGDQRFVGADVPVGDLGWTLSYFQPLSVEEARTAAIARSVILAAIVLIGLALIALHRSIEKRMIEDKARRDLEFRVAQRTAELSTANSRLEAEYAEREQADRRYRASREELAQANRLSSIGQITAGVAHEINQPVAAIRAFAENAGKLLDRERGEEVKENLANIVGLTQRIGTITAELRQFARRGTPAIGAIVVHSVIDGAILLVGDRIRASGIAVERTGADGSVRVIADRVRLEQVVINLLQNAIESIDDRSDGRIIIDVFEEDDVRIAVRDNGSGVAPELLDDLFTPFVTGRPDGLGLGLGIARDIAREFGGDLIHEFPTDGGATFTIILRRAPK